jgi:hypothetical protein
MAFANLLCSNGEPSVINSGVTKIFLTNLDEVTLLNK